MPRIADEVERASAELEKATNTLHAFVLVHANADTNGQRLYHTSDAREVLLFQVWLRACAELGIAPPPIPNRAAID